MNKDNAEKTEMSSQLIPFNRWLRSIGKSRVTGWNWRKQGIVKTTNIFGRIYISRTEIARFEARATSGEFARCEHRFLQYVTAGSYAWWAARESIGAISLGQ